MLEDTRHILLGALDIVAHRARRIDDEAEIKPVIRLRLENLVYRRVHRLKRVYDCRIRV